MHHEEQVVCSLAKSYHQSDSEKSSCYTPRRVAFYRDVLGATVLRQGEPMFLRLGNIWLTINIGGGPTDETSSRRFDAECR